MYSQLPYTIHTLSIRSDVPGQTRISQIVTMVDIPAILNALCDSKHIERERAKGQLEILLKQTSKMK